MAGGRELNLSPAQPWSLGHRGEEARLQPGAICLMGISHDFLSPTKGSIFSATLGPAEEENHGIIITSLTVYPKPLEASIVTVPAML